MPTGRNPRPYPGAQFTFTCPIDGLALKTTQPTLVGDLTRDAMHQGGHLHVEVDSKATCSNGHTWRLWGDILLERAE